MNTHKLVASDFIPQHARPLNAPFAELYKWDDIGALLIGKIVADNTRDDERGKPWRTLTLSPVVVISGASNRPNAAFAELAITATASIAQALPVKLTSDIAADYRGKCYVFHYDSDESLHMGQTLKHIFVYEAPKTKVVDALNKLDDPNVSALLGLLDEQAKLPF